MTSTEPRIRDRSRRRGALGRAVAVVLVLLAWLAIGGAGGMAQGTLSQVQENDQAAFLPAGAESTRADAAARDFTDSTTLPALIVATAHGGGALSPDQLAAAQSFAAAVPDLALPDGGRLADALTGPVVAVPAEDGAAVLVPVPLDATQANELVGPEEDRLVNVVVDDLRALAGERLPAAGLADVGDGAGGLRRRPRGRLRRDRRRSCSASRSSSCSSSSSSSTARPSLPFAVLLTAVFGLCLAALVVKPLAGAGVLQLNGQSQGILSILVIGAATDYSLLLVARYREELTRHEHPAAAMRAAWRATLEPILASAGTVIAGLLCLLLSDLGSNSSLGPVAAIGIASAVLAALTLLPAMLLVAGRRSRYVFWPRIPRYAPAADGRMADGAAVDGAAPAHAAVVAPARACGSGCPASSRGTTAPSG